MSIKYRLRDYSGNRPIYRVNATPSGRWWAMSSPDVDGALSQGATLAKAESMIQDAISMALDAPLDSFILDITVVLC